MNKIDLNNVDQDQTFETLSELRSLDLQKVSIDYVKQLLAKLYKHIGVRHRLQKDRFVQRGVLLCSEADDYFPADLQRISYNPNGSKAGRANFEGESVFYACVATEVIKGYNCTAMELLPMIDKGICQYRIVIGNWILQQDTEFVFIGGDSNLTYTSLAAKQRHEKLKDFVVGFRDSSLALYAIDKFLCGEFSKEVAKDRPWEYKISAAYVSLLKENGEKGLIYPSVKSAGAGLNLILFTEQVDQALIKFDKAVYGVYHARDMQLINEYTMGANEREGKLVWHEVYSRLPGAIKDFYVGRSDINPARAVPVVDLDPENRSSFKKGIFK